MNWPHHLSLAHVELAPAAEWVTEFPGWCFLRLSQGQGYWLEGGAAQELETGQLAVLSPLREGLFRASTLQAVALDYFRFVPELVSGVLSPSEQDCFSSLAVQPGYALRIFLESAPWARMLGELLEDGASGNALWQRAGVIRFVAAIFREELARPGPPTETTFLSARQKLRMLMRQMPETEFMAVTPQEMASRCGSSLTHFNRSFRRLFGMSLGEKQERIRLQRARQALMETSGRLDVLAEEAGYSTVKEFSIAFKKHFDVSPNEWRRPKTRLSKSG